MESTIRRAFRYASLDHWRGVACLSVLIFHSFGPLAAHRDSLHPLIKPIAWAASHGWFGVHLFFVISGYCVTVKVYQMFSRGHGAAEFLGDRILRIYPMYWVACIFAVTLAITLSAFSKGSLCDSLPRGFVGVVANATLTEPYWGLPPLILVSWSLVYEVGFYFLMAGGIFLSRSLKSWIPSLLVGYFCAVAGVLGAGNIKPLYVLKYWPEFVFGISVYLFVYQKATKSGRAWGWTFIPISLVASFWAAGGNWTQSTLPATAAFSVLLMLLHSFDERICSLKELRWLAWCGGIAYSLYLVHLPIVNRVMNAGLRRLDPTAPTVLLLLTLAWATAIAVAFTLFKYFETPLERWRHGVSKHGILNAFSNRR